MVRATSAREGVRRSVPSVFGRGCGVRSLRSADAERASWAPRFCVAFSKFGVRREC